MTLLPAPNLSSHPSSPPRTPTLPLLASPSAKTASPPSTSSPLPGDMTPYPYRTNTTGNSLKGNPTLASHTETLLFSGISTSHLPPSGPDPAGQNTFLRVPVTWERQQLAQAAKKIEASRNDAFQLKLEGIPPPDKAVAAETTVAVMIALDPAYQLNYNNARVHWLIVWHVGLFGYVAGMMFANGGCRSFATCCFIAAVVVTVLGFGRTRK